jgi:heme-degrading monooxygenase HmoA
MAVAVITNLQSGVEQYDQITAKINPEEEPADGMIIHTAGLRQDGGMRIFDIWESEEAYNSFREARLMPAVKEVLGEIPAEPPDIEIYELHHVLNP